jgi:hypothetical protein
MVGQSPRRRRGIDDIRIFIIAIFRHHCIIQQMMKWWLICNPQLAVGGWL